MDHGGIGLEKGGNILIIKDKMQLIYSLKNEHTKVFTLKQIELESLQSPGQISIIYDK